MCQVAYSMYITTRHTHAQWGLAQKHVESWPLRCRRASVGRWRAALRLSRSLCLLRALASSFWRSLYLWVLTLPCNLRRSSTESGEDAIFNTCLPLGWSPGPKALQTFTYIYTQAQIRPLHCTISSLALRRSAITWDSCHTHWMCMCMCSKQWVMSYFSWERGELGKLIYWITVAGHVWLLNFKDSHSNMIVTWGGLCQALH